MLTNCLLLRKDCINLCAEPRIPKQCCQFILILFFAPKTKSTVEAGIKPESFVKFRPEPGLNPTRKAQSHVQLCLVSQGLFLNLCWGQGILFSEACLFIVSRKVSTHPLKRSLKFSSVKLALLSKYCYA